MDRVRVARGLAFGRIGIGVLALFPTTLFLCVLAGREAAQTRVAKMGWRLFGIREIAIGRAELDVLKQGQGIERFLALCLAVDVADAVWIFKGRRSLPLRGRIIAIGLASFFAALEARALLAGTKDRAPAL